TASSSTPFRCITTRRNSSTDSWPAGRPDRPPTRPISGVSSTGPGTPSRPHGRASQEMNVPTMSIIMPVLDEAPLIGAALQALAPLRQRGVEVVVVDGGSRDNTMDLARSLADRVITAPRGRAAQMNAGAEAARGDVLLFLHADTRLPDAADTVVSNWLRASGRAWGRFDVTIEGQSPWVTIIAAAMNC